MTSLSTISQIYTISYRQIAHNSISLSNNVDGVMQMIYDCGVLVFESIY